MASSRILKRDGKFVRQETGRDSQLLSSLFNPNLCLRFAASHSSFVGRSVHTGIPSTAPHNKENLLAISLRKPLQVLFAGHDFLEIGFSIPWRNIGEPPAKKRRATGRQIDELTYPLRAPISYLGADAVAGRSTRKRKNSEKMQYWRTTRKETKSNSKAN
jgi:hypothetical protein